LTLSENQISDISVLKGLGLLGYINLEDNQITDLKPLIDNTGIGVRDVIYLKGNPLNEVSLNSYVPALEKRTARVSLR
jgi:Leucine-rich repeat (LRR) protein